MLLPKTDKTMESMPADGTINSKTPPPPSSPNTVHIHQDGLFEYILTGPLHVASAVKKTSMAIADDQKKKDEEKPSEDLIDLNNLSLMETTVVGREIGIENETTPRPKSATPDSLLDRESDYESEEDDPHPYLLIDPNKENAIPCAEQALEYIVDYVVEKVNKEDEEEEAKKRKEKEEETATLEQKDEQSESRNFERQIEVTSTPAKEIDRQSQASLDSESFLDAVDLQFDQSKECMIQEMTSLNQGLEMSIKSNHNNDNLPTERLRFYADQGQKCSLLINTNEHIQVDRLIVKVRLGTLSDDQTGQEAAAFEKWSLLHSNEPLFTIEPSSGPGGLPLIRRVSPTQVDLPWQCFRDSSKLIVITFNLTSSQLPDIAEDLHLLVDIYDQKSLMKVSSVAFAVRLFWPGGATRVFEFCQMFGKAYLDSIKTPRRLTGNELVFGQRAYPTVTSSTLALPPTFWSIKNGFGPFRALLSSPSNYGDAFPATTSTYLTRSEAYTLRLVPFNFHQLVVSRHPTLITSIRLFDPIALDGKKKDLANWSAVYGQDALEIDLTASQLSETVRDVVRLSTEEITIYWIPYPAEERPELKLVLKFNFTSAQINCSNMFFAVSTFEEGKERVPVEIDYVSCLITIMEPGESETRRAQDRFKFETKSKSGAINGGIKVYHPILEQTVLTTDDAYITKLILFVTEDNKHYVPLQLTQLSVLCLANALLDLIFGKIRLSFTLENIDRLTYNKRHLYPKDPNETVNIELENRSLIKYHLRLSHLTMQSVNIENLNKNFGCEKIVQLDLTLKEKENAERKKEMYLDFNSFNIKY